jgi:hypothetical protein
MHFVIIENNSLTTEDDFQVVPDVETWDTSQDKNLRILRRLIWLYFWLLIFEGALRKWLLPSLSTPLLIVRDPVVLLIYLQALRSRRFSVNGSILVGGILMAAFILMAVIQILAGVGGGAMVALYGLRTDFLHLPVIFVIPYAFSYRDVIKLGKWVLLLSVPMTILMVMQYRAPAGSWLNAGAGGDFQQLQFAMGKVRPAGTFSFTSGAAQFYALGMAFLIFGLSRNKVYPRWLLAASLVSVAVAQPVSGSRTLVLSCGIVFVAAILFGLFHPNQSKHTLMIGVLVTVLVAALSLTSFFREAIDTFMVRWDSANTSSGGVQRGIVGRFFNEFLEPFDLLPQAGLIGRGLGMGTNAASAMLTGTRVFLLAEGEWARVVLEVGPLLGFAFLAYRVWLGVLIALRAVRGAKQGQLLPWLLAFEGCREVIMEQFSQPTNLGFTVLVCGLCLAAFSENWAPVKSGTSIWEPLVQHEPVL